MTKATIHKIHPLKTSVHGNSYIRVEFLLEDGKWAKTDICPDFRNYKFWKDALKAGEGTELDNLFFKRQNAAEIDADSRPRIIKKLHEQKTLLDES